MIREVEYSVFNGDVVKYPSPPKIDSNKNNSEKPRFLEKCTNKHKKVTTQVCDRSLFIVRHGERVDFVFGSWIPYCFDNGENYIRRDLNMPKTLPKRRNGPNGYLADSPLTNLGLFQASTIGEALQAHKADIKYIYSSPAFRSIQTSQAIIDQLDNKGEIKIRVEPGLFEMSSWYIENRLDWLLVEELSEAGYKVDIEYKPIFSAEDIIKNVKENHEDYYKRGSVISNAVLQNHPDGNILLVGHSSTLDICSRELIGQKPREINEMFDIITKVPYCGLAQLNCVKGEWQIVEPCLPLTHGKNPRYDWRIMLN